MLGTKARGSHRPDTKETALFSQSCALWKVATSVVYESPSRSFFPFLKDHAYLPPDVPILLLPAQRISEVWRSLFSAVLPLSTSWESFCCWYVTHKSLGCFAACIGQVIRQRVPNRSVLYTCISTCLAFPGNRADPGSRQHSHQVLCLLQDTAYCVAVVVKQYR